MEFTSVRGEEVNILLKSFSDCQRREGPSARCVFRPLPFLGNSHFLPPPACSHLRVDGDTCTEGSRDLQLRPSPLVTIFIPAVWLTKNCRPGSWWVHVGGGGVGRSRDLSMQLYQKVPCACSLSYPSVYCEIVCEWHLDRIHSVLKKCKILGLFTVCAVRSQQSILFKSFRAWQTHCIF